MRRVISVFKARLWPVGPLVVVVSLSRRISGGFDTHTGRQFLVRAESKGLSPIKWVMRVRIPSPSLSQKISWWRSATVSTPKNILSSYLPKLKFTRLYFQWLDGFPVTEVCEGSNPFSRASFGSVDQWLDRLVVSEEVEGSSPFRPAKLNELPERHGDADEIIRDSNSDVTNRRDDQPVLESKPLR